MYDGITASSVPGDGWAVAGYVNGAYRSYTALTQRYPDLIHISISVNDQGTALVLDVEKYDATPQQAPGWVRRMRAAGIAYPVVYMNTSTWQTVKDEFTAQGVAQPLYWVAQYDGIAVLPAGAIAKQHTNTPGYDMNVVADYWPGVDPVPHPLPDPTSEEDDMQQIEPIADHPGEYAYGVPSGKVKVAFVADGYTMAPAKLRVVLWVGGAPQVHDGVSLGGTAAKYATLALPTGCDAVTVRREDDSAFPVGAYLI